MNTPINIHTHHTEGKPGESIICVHPTNFSPQPCCWYTVGIHPWLVESSGNNNIEQMLECASHPQVLAIGESGFDRLRGGDIESQFKAFKCHIKKSEEFGKPLIVHMVRSSDLLLKTRKDLTVHEPWIIHGFRGKPQEALQLLRAGMFLSFGEYYNVEALRATPTDRLFLETDESTCGIETIYNKVACDLQLGVEVLREVVKKNIDAVFFNKIKMNCSNKSTNFAN